MNMRNRFSTLALAAPLATSMSTLTMAQNANRQIGTQFTVTAEPLIERPDSQPCVVPLFANYTFAHFSDSTQTFAYAPPGNCSGPWKKVIFEADFSENGGSQFDRTASIYLANANIYFGTTPEPLPKLTNTWHVERDVTDYSALFATTQQGAMALANCTSDCPPPFNTLSGVFTVSANLEFYPAEGEDRERRHEEGKGKRAPDQVLPLEQSNGSGGVNMPATLSLPTDQLATTFTLPANTERAYLDVIAQSQGNDEQWFACFPNDLASTNLVYGCGNTDFRESEITIDGTLSGIAPVSPWVYTGFLPDQWRPIPAVQTLSFVPYRVNLTPFASVLSDGRPHTIAMSVFNNDNHFSATASLLLFLDQGGTHVTGAVTKNTLVSPSPVVTENLTGTATVTGNVNVASNRNFNIAGYVNTSHGKVGTSLFERQNFSGTQTVDFDTVNSTVLDQNTAVKTSLYTATTISNRNEERVIHDYFSFPITVDFIFPVAAAHYGFTVVTAQKYHTSRQVWRNGDLVHAASVTNSVKASDVAPASSSQTYTFENSAGDSCNCRIASANNILVSVSSGCKQQEDEQ